MNELALFAGAGGGILGGVLLGWSTVCAVELGAYARDALLRRQDDGILPAFPIWDDVCTFDGKSWNGIVDVVSGGFPCQDISAAGKGAGIAGERSGLWKQFARIIGEVEPAYAFIENSPLLSRRGLDAVLRDLASLGYDAEWDVFSASEVGAPHLRERIWILAYSNSIGLSDRLQGRYVGRNRSAGRKSAPSQGRLGTWWESEPDVGRVADGVAHRVDRLSALGNGQVPAVAAVAWEKLMERIERIENG